LVERLIGFPSSGGIVEVGGLPIPNYDRLGGDYTGFHATFKELFILGILPVSFMDSFLQCKDFFQMIAPQFPTKSGKIPGINLALILNAL